MHSIHHTFGQNRNVKKYSFGKNNRYKIYLLFSFAGSNSSQILIGDSYMIWSTIFISLILCMGFLSFDFGSFLSKQSSFFCLAKYMKSFTLKLYNSSQNYNSRKATSSFAPRALILKLCVVSKSVVLELLSLIDYSSIKPPSFCTTMTILQCHVIILRSYGIIVTT